MSQQLLIQNGNTVFEPVVQDGVTWTTERKGAAGKLEFKVLKDNIINFEEGNPVAFKVDNTNLFYGFVFKKKRDKEKIITTTAYDQLRYLKNKDTKTYIIGITFDRTKNIIKSFTTALTTTWDITVQMVEFLGQLVTGRVA